MEEKSERELENEASRDLEECEQETYGGAYAQWLKDINAARKELSRRRQLKELNKVLLELMQLQEEMRATGSNRWYEVDVYIKNGRLEYQAIGH
ncbi:MAG: hypothetical protein ACP5T3_01350 [Candidatus Micrarchaeia archaeon]